MNPAIELTLNQAFDFLLHVAVVRPVFLWGVPGIGKTALVNRFAAAVGLECVALLAWREGLCGKTKTVFCPADASMTPYRQPPDWKMLLAEGISRGVSQAIERAGGLIATPTGPARPPTAAERLVYCDATAHDAGWLPPETLLERVAVKGRGGTVLQRGVDCLREAARRNDFPLRGPVLLITDGYCEDRLDIAFDHAFLTPEGHSLPFTPRGEVFWLR